MLYYYHLPSDTVIFHNHQGSLHVIHGLDVARAILAIRDDFTKAQGERWILTDGRVYDWWDLASAWGSDSPAQAQSVANAPSTEPSSRHPSTTGALNEQKAIQVENNSRGPQPTWVRELMVETGVRGLPRDVQHLGRALDSRDFWNTFRIDPLMTFFH